MSNFRNLSDDIRRNIPDVLLATMNILHKKYKQSKCVESQINILVLSLNYCYSIPCRAPRGFVQTRRDDGDTDEVIGFSVFFKLFSTNLRFLFLVYGPDKETSPCFNNVHWNDPLPNAWRHSCEIGSFTVHDDLKEKSSFNGL